MHNFFPSFTRGGSFHVASLSRIMGSKEGKTGWHAINRAPVSSVWWKMTEIEISFINSFVIYQFRRQKMT
jgi:hypothetical protein